jgi:protein FRA10AC1
VSRLSSAPTSICAKSLPRFLREDDDKALTWDDQVAQKYYSNLYREFAVCDLKHYKSGNVSAPFFLARSTSISTNIVIKQFALRWRTEAEVLSGAGETSCGNTRCAHHDVNVPMPALSTLELPFVYEEQRETKSALVKIVLCERCVKKLMWKRQKEKEQGTVSPDIGEGSRDEGERWKSRKRRRIEDKTDGKGGP